MKITYTENPLSSIVELDEIDIKILRNNIEIDELKNIIIDTYYALRENDINKAIKLNDILLINKNSQFSRQIDKLLEHYINSLKDTHIGNCTGIPVSCDKCLAESLLGIDTIPNSNKHTFDKIQFAFKTVKTIDEAINILENIDYSIETTNSYWQDNSNDYYNMIPKWKNDDKNAIKYLIKYKETYLDDEDEEIK